MDCQTTSTDYSKMLKKDSTGLVIRTFLQYIEQFKTEHGTVAFRVDVGSKYLRIMDTLSNGQTCGWAFIDRETGDVFKPATWKKPAKHARGNVFDGINADVNYGCGKYGPHYMR